MRYTPGQSDLATETRRIADVLNGPTFPFLFLEQLQTAPDKPQDGMIAFGAAGVLGVAEGFYGYYSSTWNLLG